MTKKFFPDDCITLDGRMDEAVWNEVPEYTGFTTMKKLGGNLVNDQTFVKILPCNNYIYFGIKCMDANMEFAKNYVSRDIYSGNSVEVFLSPANTVSQIYNFALTIDGFKPVAGQGTELAKLYSASLILKSETTLRIFFKVDAAVENLTVTYQGQTLEVKQRSGLSYVDVVGISAKALDEVVTVTVNDGANTAEVAFNPMSYSQGVLNDTTGAFGQDMKDLVAALYLYNKAANVYFKEV